MTSSASSLSATGSLAHRNMDLVCRSEAKLRVTDVPPPLLALYFDNQLLGNIRFVERAHREDSGAEDADENDRRDNGPAPDDSASALLLFGFVEAGRATLEQGSEQIAHDRQIDSGAHPKHDPP